MKEFLVNLLKAIFRGLFTNYKTVENYNDMINVSCILQNRKWSYEDIVKQVLSQQLGVDDVLLTISDNTKMLDKLSPEDIQYQAILVKMGEKAYALYVRKTSFSPVVLCHELKHLQQYHQKKLELMPSKGYKWLGKEYPASYPYDSRPWEREAFAAQAKLWRNYKQFKKSKKNETTNNSKK